MEEFAVHFQRFHCASVFAASLLSMAALMLVVSIYAQARAARYAHADEIAISDMINTDDDSHGDEIKHAA